MKKLKFLSASIFALFCVSFIQAQTAEEIIAKYINALGGKENISQVKSVYSEGTADAMGNQGVFKTTLLDKKGYKQEFSIMGTEVIMCYTDSMGWQINPMSGNYSAEAMSDAQYKASKDQIYVAGPLALDYKALGYNIEEAGQETVGSVNANKIKITSPDGIEAFYYFDPESAYLIKVVQKGEMMGQPMDIAMRLSEYQKPENGFFMPYLTEVDYGGQFFLTIKANKVEINKEVDPAIFVKP